MEPASLFRDKPPSEQGILTVFWAEMIAREEASWRELFAGFDHLKAITYSSGLDLILELTGMFSDVEVTFGCERILSREHAALEQASNIARGYTFVDAVTDQKAFLERLAAEMGKSARALLPRVANGTLRFRLLRKMPSHEKLYLLAGEGRYRVITGSANLSLAALCGRHKELYVVFEGEESYRAHQTAPTDGVSDDRIARASIVTDTGEVFLEDNLWLGSQSELDPEEIRADAMLMVEYLASFANFFGNTEGAISSYWTFLSWLYAAPVAPWLRQAAVLDSGRPPPYPVFGLIDWRA